jgi:hypothetical protein
MRLRSARQVADCYARGSEAREIAEARDAGANSQNLLKMTAASKANPSLRQSYDALIALVYRSKEIGPDELARAVLIDCVRANEKGALYKQKSPH